MMRWIFRFAIVASLAFLLSYIVDWVIFALRGSPSAKITVNQYQVVPLKGHKNEYDYLGSEDEPCSVSLFPRNGMSTCWWLKQHRNQTTNL
jgi:hypothetical protein